MSVVRGPARRGAPFGAEVGGIHFRQPQMQEKGPAKACFCGKGAQNPAYITTVWGYGYKWG